MRDNFDFYDDHERDQARHTLPVCDICGEEMVEWVAVPQKFGELNVCESCVRKYWKSYEEE